MRKKRLCFLLFPPPQFSVCLCVPAHVCVCGCVCPSWRSSSRFQSSPPYNQLLSVASIHVERPALLSSSPRWLQRAKQGLRFG